jgi:hypothetical protein
VRGSTTTYRSSATATDASLAGKKSFLGNNRAVNGRIACLRDSGRDKSGEQFVSSDVAKARDGGSDCAEFIASRNSLAKFTKFGHHRDSDWGSDHDEFAACRNSLAKFTKSYHHRDSDWGSDYDEFAACRNGLAKFTKSYHHRDSDLGSDYDEFAACRNGLAKFTKSYHHRDPVRFRCIRGDCAAASDHVPSYRHPPKRLSQCPRGSRVGLSGGYEA